jgi:nitrate/TMAO reductase-like tetraheme cytochrome c subunit
VDSEPRKSIKEIILQKKVICVLLVLAFIAMGGMAVVANKPEFCASCHNMQSYYKSWHEGDLLAKKHADANVSCHDCHQASLAQKMDEGIKQITGDYEEPMEKRQYANDFCTKCHDMGKVKAKTVFTNNEAEVNPHDSHLGEQDCNTCHTMHQPSKLDCTRCHYGEKWMSKLPKYWK